MTRLDKYVLAFALGVVAVGLYGVLTKERPAPPYRDECVICAMVDAANGYKR